MMLKFLNKYRLSPILLTLGYIFIAVLWILASDYLILSETVHSHIVAFGLIFITISAGLFYILLHNWQSHLLSTNDLLKAIIDTAPMRIFWKDKDLNYMGCNSAFAKDAGEKTSESIIGKSDYQLSWREQAALYRADDFEIILSGHPKLAFEEPQTGPDGNQLWLSTSKVPLRNRQNEIIGILGIYDDITSRKEIENSLVHEKITAQNYLDIVGVMILVLDNEKNVKLINQHGCEIIGYSADEVIGKNWIENFLPERFRNKVNDVGNSLIKPDNPHINYFENPVLTKNGEERLIAWRNTSLLDPEGNIIGILTSGEDITERKKYEERISYLANFDILTGLPNRILLDEHFHNILSTAKRNERIFAVMFLDLDHFKEINDSLGHSYGDALLIEIAKRLKNILRTEDVLARLGGDEFVILLPGTESHGAAKVAQKLLETVIQPVVIDEHEFTISVSIGIALYPADGSDMELLSKNADAAMYRAKQEGRNNYHFFTQEMQEHATRNLKLGNALRHAIERDELHLVYQPQISLREGRVIGAEALIRWNHPEFGNISPAVFIPIAEENGLILPIGEWVLKNAVAQLKRWIDSGHDPIIMAINLSAVQFRHSALPDLISTILLEAQLPPEYLEIELTERATMHDPNSAIATMNQLHQQGIRMSIDDFGTGYSSLSYLKKFNIYKLKIDQSFVRDITTDAEDKAIVGAIINMANGLGMLTIAEGVETISQLDYLSEQGCHEVQGYYFSKPLAPPEFEAFIATWKNKNIVTRL